MHICISSSFLLEWKHTMPIFYTLQGFVDQNLSMDQESLVEKGRHTCKEITVIQLFPDYVEVYRFNAIRHKL